MFVYTHQQTERVCQRPGLELALCLCDQIAVFSPSQLQTLFRSAVDTLDEGLIALDFHHFAKYVRLCLAGGVVERREILRRVSSSESRSRLCRGLLVPDEPRLHRAPKEHTLPLYFTVSWLYLRFT